MECVALAIFVCALAHTFLVKSFEHLAHIDLSVFDFEHKKFTDEEQHGFVDWALLRFPRVAHWLKKHHGIFMLLGEVELVFIIWAVILAVFMTLLVGSEEMVTYVDSRNMTEPLFVFCIMMVSASRPIKQCAEHFMMLLSRAIPTSQQTALLFTLLFVGPLLGSFITEPAAMTITALLLGKIYFVQVEKNTRQAHRFRYTVLAALLVNVSIGGTLTSYAAPPVLMVANTWHWDITFMFSHFGWKAMVAVFCNTILVVTVNKNMLKNLVVLPQECKHIPLAVTIIHLVILTSIVLFSHHPKVFMGVFAIYFGIALSYKAYQDDQLYIRESVMVGLFLAGLVVLGGMQKWWLQPLLTSMDNYSLFGAATSLTAITDNAALTYLGSLVEGLNERAKYLLVAGAVTGGGLTIIANAPNPAGIGILRKHFGDQTVSNGKLLWYALLPTAIAAAAFLFLPSFEFGSLD